MSVRDIKHHHDNLYGYELLEQTISNITEAVMEKAKEWRPSKATTPQQVRTNKKLFKICSMER